MLILYYVPPGCAPAPEALAPGAPGGLIIPYIIAASPGGIPPGGPPGLPCPIYGGAPQLGLAYY